MTYNHIVKHIVFITILNGLKEINFPTIIIYKYKLQKECYWKLFVIVMISPLSVP